MALWPGRDLDILPLQPEQLADAAARRNARDDEIAEMRAGVLLQPLLLAGLSLVSRIFEPTLRSSGSSQS